LELITLTDLGEQAHGLRRCANAALAACNWLIEDGDPNPLCRSCRLTRVRPNDEDSEGLAAFAKAEAAKRRLLFQLFDLGLPVDEDRLRFDLLSSRSGPVVTGHTDGVITIDLAELDDAQRERRRAELDEPYRTVLGHFRHEIGHYYWPILVEGSGAEELEQWRSLFGDERTDYQEALQRHYEQGAPPDWSERHVSAYATMHPWEDWAETFAHYLHIRDALQTAAAFGMLVVGPHLQPGLMAAPTAEPQDDFREILADWLPLVYALNAVNRSMGKGDLYPFVLSPAVVKKLTFVHGAVRGFTSRPVPSTR
jgi:hypothetical protein